MEKQISQHRKEIGELKALRKQDYDKGQQNERVRKGKEVNESPANLRKVPKLDLSKVKLETDDDISEVAYDKQGTSKNGGNGVKDGIKNS